MKCPQRTDDGNQEADDINVEEFDPRCDAKQHDRGPIAGIRSGGIKESKQVAVCAIGHEPPDVHRGTIVVTESQTRGMIASELHHSREPAMFATLRRRRL